MGLLSLSDAVRFDRMEITNMANVTVKISSETRERYKFYSEVTGRTIRESVEEALNNWMDTFGAADILLETGVDIAPELAGPVAPALVTLN